jgi:hypothetical protein
MVGAHSRDLLTYQGRVIVHNDRAEMEFLFPNTRVTRVSDGDLGQPVMRLRDHPEVVALGIQFPLRRGDFR